ncbi:MAG TPA: tripartite tricarboxylate transporter substrate-binding protein, partial [Casimicrobiaceae bacterium]|nr:tripartite tricarboxylate transporter substrate-binding protein [Casimicrobiaceae bacterium]
MKLRSLACLAVLIVVVAAISDAAAQPYPSRPIKLIVPYGPGGAGDVIARIVSVQLGKEMGVSVVVENKPGGGGMIGAHAVATAPPDGYTVLLGNTTEMVVSPYLVKSATYETQRDFRPVALAGYLPQLIVANPSVKAATMDEFIALAKASPGTYSYATAGVGSTAHIAGALLERLAGIKLLSVPYKGGAQAVADVLAGNVSIYSSGIPPAIGHVKTGKLVALGIAGTHPVASLPNVPTLATGALARLDLTAWFGFFVPKNTPGDVVALLHDRLRQIIDSPEVQSRLIDVGV